MTLGNVLIFGDSYSTFENFIPEGYACYYISSFKNETDVRKVEETWWHQVITETGSNLLLNDSWSGSTVCNTGYNGDCSKTNSFIFRLNKYKADGFFEKNKVDTVFIFGGTNDNWTQGPVGEVKFDDITEEDLLCVLPGMSYFMKNLCETVPNAKIYCLINTELKFVIADGYKKIAEHYGVKPIVFKDIRKACGHPTVQGMIDIKNQILKEIL